MDTPSVFDAKAAVSNSQASGPSRSQSFSSQKSDSSHTAAEFINSQLQLEAEAREALPYSIDDCTKPLGSLRQILFACLTCNPPPSNHSDPYTPAGVCYSCSIQCHGEHTLVELFNKRNFTCDCGTSRLPATSPCALRIHPETNTKGGVHSEIPEPNNKYNHNFRNHFCGCECEYDPFMQKGTMFQCLGLGTAEDGGCGEDWWHPGCIVGLGPDWFESTSQRFPPRKPKNAGLLESIIEVAETAVDGAYGEAQVHANEATEPTAEDEAEDEAEEEDPPLPPGFPHEDDFEGFICYKCVDANPWIKKYAGAAGFLAPVFRRSAAASPESGVLDKVNILVAPILPDSKKRKAEDDEDSDASGPTKRMRVEGPISKPDAPVTIGTLDTPPIISGEKASKHPQLLEEEDTYEPPLSESGDGEGGSTVGSGSIYDRGESALKNVDRVRAIEGVMAYNHLRDKLKPFFQQFAESGQAISAEDIKAHFAKMRGDEQAIKEAGLWPTNIVGMLEGRTIADVLRPLRPRRFEHSYDWPTTSLYPVSGMSNPPSGLKALSPARINSDRSKEMTVARLALRHAHPAFHRPRRHTNINPVRRRSNRNHDDTVGCS
ncbi:hypothetical protein B7494_g5662 [Chlorociboria aeruginascens]|nr:hypothetical protein B7494_g5662 [Chlorociboria aeruginascens]